MFQRRHYEAVAASLRRTRESYAGAPVTGPVTDEILIERAYEDLSLSAVDRVAEELASVFKADNPRFDVHRFMVACGSDAP